MTRRIAIVVAAISIHLAACCCGPLPNVPARQKNNAEPVVVKNDEPVQQKPLPPDDKIGPLANPLPAAKPDSKPRESGLNDDEIEDLKRRPIFVKIDRPTPRDVKQITSVTIAGIKVAIVSGSLGETAFMRRTVQGLRQVSTDQQLKLKVQITNGSLKVVQYAPWYAVASKGKQTFATDEFNTLSECWLAGVASWPVGFPEKAPKIAQDQTITDLVAFDAPAFRAEEIRVFLDGANVGVPGQTFRFALARSFFEDESLRKAAIDKWHASRVAAEEKRQTIAEDKRIESVKARIAARQAEEKAAQERESSRREAERLAAIEAKRPKVRRENYNKLVDGISLEDAQAILGPAKEGSRSGGFQSVSWVGSGFPRVVISATFYNGRLKSKAIFGD